MTVIRQDVSDQANINASFKMSAEIFADKCSVIQAVNHNQATIQVTSLVETLDFTPGHGGQDKSIFPNLAPLPFTQRLRVLLVPHSHCDPGWLETYMYYYTHKVRHLLTNLYEFAESHTEFKYIYAEVSFFKLWWTEQIEEVRAGMRKLAREGRFEFVQGGWVQADEANTHYFALFNEMLDGHDWLKFNFPEAIPKSGWAIDPFGLSPMMAHVNKLFGLTGMHIARVHYRVKTHLASTKNIEFKWRQSWDATGETDMLTHMAPFPGYNSENSCGPDKNICEKFTFYKGKAKNVKVLDSNVEELSKLILDQWRKKAVLHQTDTIFIELGDDFTYTEKEYISDIYDNYTPLMEYINSDPTLNTEVKWGILSDYFDNVRAHGADKLPSLSGDFFTYADHDNDYWSGYFTSRPFYKNLDRVLESSLRRTEILYSFMRKSSYREDLVSARNALSLFQHHDAVTGTSVRKVVNDYGAILFDAYNTCNEITALAIKHLLGYNDLFSPVVVRRAFDEYEKFKTLYGSQDLVLVNTLPRHVITVQTVAVKTGGNLVVLGLDGKTVRQQMEPRIEYGKVLKDSHFVVFEASSPSVSLQSYITAPADQQNMAEVELFNTEDIYNFNKVFKTKEYDSSTCTDIVLGAERLSITIDCKSGRVSQMRRGNLSILVEQEVLMYKGKGGAYLFRPDSTPRTGYLESSGRPKVIVVKGPIRHKAVVYVRDMLVLTYTVNMVAGNAGDFVELEILSNLQENGDMVLRFKTDISNGDSLFTDNNGHTIQHHKYKEKLRIQGNFFPMPSTAFIQDSFRRLTLLSAEPHGVASLSTGSIEVVLDRRYTASNDFRGLPEGIHDNLPTPARFRILLEDILGSIDDNAYRVEYPSLLSYQVLQTLQHPLFVGHKPNTQEKTVQTVRQLITDFPCFEELVNLRHVEGATSLMIRRRLGFTCDIEYPNSCPDVRYSSLAAAFADKVTTSKHPFSPLHEQNTTESHTPKPMQFMSDYVTFVLTHDI